MKTIIKLILFLLMVLPKQAKADSYNILWKQFETFQSKDLPQSGIKILQKIAKKAEEEAEFGQLLKAELLQGKLQNEISPDSLASHVQHLKNRMQRIERKNKPLAAVYQSALGVLYRDNPTLSDENVQKSNTYFRQSLTHLELLAEQKATAYQPLLLHGIDSKWFANDLLHVLGLEAKAYETLHAFYQKQGNRAATCLTALFALQKKQDNEERLMRKSRYLQALDSLISEYKDLPVAGEVAIERYNLMENADDVTTESKMIFINYALLHWANWPRMNILRNKRAMLTVPNYHVAVGNDMQIPMTRREVYVTQLCNINQLTMQLWRVNLKGDSKLLAHIPQDLAKIQKLVTTKEPVYTQTKHYVGLPDYQLTNDTLMLPSLPIGMYLVEFVTDNKDIQPQQMLLRVSNLRLMVQEMPNNQYRFVVVNATNGQPIPCAKIRLSITYYTQNKNNVDILTCNSKGEVLYTLDAKGYFTAYPYTETDVFSKNDWVGVNGSFPKKETNTATKVSVFTDRSIYRPGQTIQTSVVVYRQESNDATPVRPNERVKLTLRDANYKVISEKEVITDTFGTAWTTFQLPTNGLTGSYSLRANAGTVGVTSFSVEDYKRPTFMVEFDEITQQYAEGDTVKIMGRAKSFTGVPVQGAKVRYTVTRRPSVWWYGFTQRGEVLTIDTDTLLTNHEGKFEVPIHMVLPEKWDKFDRRFYRFVVEANVTDVAGESHEAETFVPLSDKPTVLLVKIPEQQLADSLKQVTFTYLNNAGKPIDGMVKYSIDGHWYEAKTNEPTAQGFTKLPSKEHQLEAICGNDSVKLSFVTFTFNDKKPVKETKAFFYVSNNTFPSDGKPVRLLFGSSEKDVHVVYSVIAHDKVIEVGTVALSNELVKKEFVYRAEYGNGITISYAWVKQGVMYQYAQQIAKPQRNNQLSLQWKTFRNRLTPGQQEEWTLQIRQPDGKTAKTQLMAVLFDKALNEIKPHNWNLNTMRVPALSYTKWTTFRDNNNILYGDAHYKALNEYELKFTCFDNVFAQMSLNHYRGLRTRFNNKSKEVMVFNDVPVSVSMASMSKAKLADALGGAVMGEAVMQKAIVKDDVVPQETTKNGEQSVAFRQNFNETAFFYPALITDNKGEVSLKFTLPESITTWQFMGLAHDEAMNFGILKDEVVATKIVMVQPNVPRFVRLGDKVSLVARIFNTADKTVSGIATLELLDPETEKPLFSQKQSYQLQPNATGSATFNFDVDKVIATHPTHTLLIARVQVSGNDYEDGEQHYIAILPDKELITTTVPFTQHGVGMKSIDLAALFPTKTDANKLTIEYTNNPTWLMIQALPSMVRAVDDNAISLSAAFYATNIGKFLMKENANIATTVKQWQQEMGKETTLTSSLQTNEELKTMLLDETPWVMEADREAEQKQQLIGFFDENAMNYRIESYFKKLSLLQNADGSLSWWKGMSGSRYITTSVMKMLVRLNSMIGNQPLTNQFLNNAWRFLDEETANEVKQIKKRKASGEKNVLLSENACDYLYINALAKRPQTTDIHYLVGMLSSISTQLTIYGKANTALLLSMYNKEKEAQENLQSVREYTVYKEEMGRYFDTPNAHYSWFDYKIPTQVAAIEALKCLAPNDKMIEEMQRWLLQSKRTQAWDTPINSVDAVYAFLHQRTDLLQSMGDLPIITLNQQPLVLPKATAGLGYIKTTATSKDMQLLAIDKQTTGTSWGAVYAQSLQNVKDVKQYAAGLKVSRQVMHNDKPAKNLKVGDKIVVRITIEADRDYDFVQLQDKRAACLEPVSQLSGYRFGYYCTPKDYVTNYYFDVLRKGKHVIETAYYIDRAGVYQTGLCTIQCAYSPAFGGRTAAQTLKIDE